VRTKTPEQKEKILAAASGLFGTQRFHEVRMDDIADQAEMGKGTLYRYFQDKEQLYFAVLAHSSELFLGRVTTAVAEVEGIRAQLEALVSAIIGYFDEHPHLLDLIQRAELESALGKEFPWQHTRTELLGLVGDLFEQARVHGEASIRHPDVAALMLLGGLRSMIRLGEKPRPRTLARRIIDGFLFGADAIAGARRAQALLR
jgi:AcrR family transcriptional regulator